MAACSQCGKAVPDGQAVCDSCTAAAPRGAFSSGGTDAPPSSAARGAPVLRVHPGGQTVDPQAGRGHGGRAAALALAQQEPPRSGAADSTGARPSRGPRTGARVLPLRRPGGSESGEMPAAIDATAETVASDGPGPFAPRESGETRRMPEVREESRTASSPSIPGTDKAPSIPGIEKAPTTLSEVRRPPVLASESLEEDLRPTEPGRIALRRTGAAIGAVAAIAMVAIGGLDAWSLSIALAAAVVSGLCFAPLRYAMRATSVLAVSVVGLAVASYARIRAGLGAETLVLSIGMFVMAGGLFFRSWYRASKRARATVAAGVAILALWVVLAGGFGELTHLDPGWHSWAPAGLRVAIGLVLLLSLLAFMDQGSTGGATVWAVSALVLYATYTLVRVAAVTWQAHRSFEIGMLFAGDTGVLTAATIGSAALVAIASMAVAHVLAVTAGATTEQRHPERTPD